MGASKYEQYFSFPSTPHLIYNPLNNLFLLFVIIFLYSWYGSTIVHIVRESDPITNIKVQKSFKRKHSSRLILFLYPIYPLLALQSGSHGD